MFISTYFPNTQTPRHIVVCATNRTAIPPSNDKQDKMIYKYTTTRVFPTQIIVFNGAGVPSRFPRNRGFTVLVVSDKGE